MPVKIGSFETFSEEEFNALRQLNRGTGNSIMVELLDAVESGQPIRVSLEEGQSARGLRVVISRAATSRGLNVETVEGDGFVAVRKVDQQASRKSAQVTPGQGKRRGRPPKRQADD